MQNYPLIIQFCLWCRFRVADGVPVATPPNAVVFGTGRLPIATMAREGLVLNFIDAIVITLVCYFLIA